MLDRLVMLGIAGRVTKKPRVANCAHCGMALIVALETCADAAGAPVALDAVPVTPEGEIRAALVGLDSYAHWGDCLTYRMPQFTAFRPGSSNAVLVEHRCGARWEADPAAMNRLYCKGVARPGADDAPPF